MGTNGGCGCGSTVGEPDRALRKVVIPEDAWSDVPLPSQGLRAVMPRPMPQTSHTTMGRTVTRPGARGTVFFGAGVPLPGLAGGM